jgi:predicted nucleotidyltransferase
MTNTSRQTYKELAIPYFEEVFQTIDEIMTESEIPCYLIGVTAIALELLENDIKPSRGTKDIDFAIMIKSLDQFEEVVAKFELKGFHKAKAPWTLYHKDYNVAVDLLPFGEIEEYDTVKFNERYSDLHVLGFTEVMNHSKEIRIEEMIANIPPLHGMVILKLVAWSDRPEERDNDPYDILRIIEHYFDIEYNSIVEFHNDIFPDAGTFDRLKIASRVLGRNCAEILIENVRLKDRIIAVIDGITINPEKSSFAIRWARDKDWTLDYASGLLTELKTGILERLT